MYIYILSIKYNNARENKTTARAIGKLVCSTPLEIPNENVLSQRKQRVGLTVYNGRGRCTFFFVCQLPYHVECKGDRNSCII